MDTEEVASKVVSAMCEEQFWILSHPELLDEVNHRNQQLTNLENPTLISSFTD